jgi:hypothetical protein
MVECIKRMYNGTKFCVNCQDDEVTDFVEQRRGVGRGCSLSPFCNIIIGDITDYISKRNVREPVVEKM